MEPPEPFSTSRLWKKRPSVPAQVRRARPTQTREGMGGGGAGGRHTPIAGAKHAYIAHYLRIAIAHKIDKRKQVKPFCRFDLLFCLERVTGIEPASSAWKAEVLPLNHTRMRWSGRLDSNQRPSAPKADALPSCATPRSQARSIGERAARGKRAHKAPFPGPGRGRRLA